MKHLLFLAVILLGLLPVRALEPFVDGVAAAVNDEIVTFSQVQELTGSIEARITIDLVGENRTKEIQKVRMRALNDLIDRQLIIQEFRKMKGAIPTYVIDDRITALIREQFGGDKVVFRKTIMEQGYTIDKLKKMEEEKIIVNAMRSREVKGEPIIPESKIVAYYNEHRKEWTTNDEVKLRMIKIKGEAEPERKRQMTKEIRDKVNRSSDFADLARIYSDDSTQDKGGDWGWQKRGDLKRPMEDVVFAQQKGKVSEIIEMEGSFYLILIEDRKEGVTKPLKEMRPDIEKHLAQIEKQKMMQAWTEKLRKKAYIKIY